MDTEIAQCIEENLAPWPGAWKERQPDEYLRVDAYQKVLAQYKDTVSQYTVSHRLCHQIKQKTD